jgi:hypothetical protein
VNKEEPIADRALDATALLALQDGQLLPQRGSINKDGVVGTHGSSSKDYGPSMACYVKQRPMIFDGESFASGLKGASHPVSIPLRVAGATRSSRSPLRDRSTMASCVIDREVATTVV